MLSRKIIKKLDKLHKNQNEYEPRLDIADRLARKAIIMLVGATCEGKNVVMDATAAIDPRFCVAGTLTSDQPYSSDIVRRYTYCPNDDAGVLPILEDIKQHLVVQYAVDPYSHCVYCSTVDDYPGEYNLADVLSNAVANFARLGFRQTTAITLISNPSTWLKRFEERFPPGHPMRKARRDEAIESFTWSLAQGQDHFWVYNPDDQPGLAAQEVIAIGLGASGGQPDTRDLATVSLATAQGIAV